MGYRYSVMHRLILAVISCTKFELSSFTLSQDRVDAEFKSELHDTNHALLGVFSICRLVLSVVNMCTKFNRKRRKDDPKFIMG